MTGQSGKTKIHFNVGTIFFILIFIYMTGHLIVDLRHKNPTTYEVVKSELDDSIRATGLILRNETVVKATETGYLNYYVNESERIAKNELVYTCDETGKVHDYISNLLKREQKLSSEDFFDIKDEIVQFMDQYDDSYFQQVYGLKYDLESKAMQMGDTVLEKHMSEIEAKMGGDSFTKNYSSESGVITYIQDGFEKKRFENLKPSDFDLSDYRKNELTRAGKVKAGEPVYRLTNGSEWEIIVPVSGRQYKMLADKKYVNVTIFNDDIRVECPISLQRKGKERYAVLTMNKYLGYYAKERYLNVEIEVNKEDGLKVPSSAVVKKEFYKIPYRFFSGNSAAQKEIVMRTEKFGGDISFEKKMVPISKKSEEDKCYYILKEEIPEGAVLCEEDSTDTYKAEKTVRLPGVFSLNRGYANFRVIDILMKNKDYTVVKDNADFSISLYDRIILSSENIENNQIIY